jgi:chromosome segregation ATPase
VNAKAMLEKEQLLIRLNALQEIQNRYQNLKKAYDDLNQQFGELGTRTRDLEEQHIKIQAEKKNLESRLESATKLVEERAQQIKILRERCDRAMTMASKYSPEVVNSLQ